MERPETAAGVVEDAVKDNAHATRVAGVEQFAHCRVPTEERIDLEVVIRVVPVVRRGGEHRIEVDRVDAEPLEMVEVFDHAEQVTALEAVDRRRRVPRLQRPGLGHPCAASEAVREDLVEDRVPDPGGGFDHDRAVSP